MDLTTASHLTPHPPVRLGQGSFASLFHVRTVLLRYSGLLIIITFVHCSVLNILPLSLQWLQGNDKELSQMFWHIFPSDDRAVSSGKYLDLQPVNNFVFPYHNYSLLLKSAEGEGETVFSVDFCHCMTTVITTTNNWVILVYLTANDTKFRHISNIANIPQTVNISLQSSDQQVLLIHHKCWLKQ